MKLNSQRKNNIVELNKHLANKYRSSNLESSISRLAESDIDLEAESQNIKLPGKISLAVKRTIDVVGALTLIILLSPILIATSILVMILTDGPVLYREKRIGYKGKAFDFLKFRSMGENADCMQNKLRLRNEMGGPFFKMRNDPRVTEFGRFIRKYSIDELPQLFNVLKGDMSLVGPRPCKPEEFKELKPWQQRAKTLMKPGLTCIWQTSGRNLISDHNIWMQMDLEYIKDWSLELDIKLLLKTVPAVLSGIGAS